MTKWTATWNLSNHQTVDFSIAPGASVFRGWTLNINGPMKRGQVYYIKFGGLMSVVRFASALLVYLALIRYLVNTYHRIFGGGE